MKQSIIALKSFFETGDKPNQDQFRDLIDSFVHKDEGKIVDSFSINQSGDITFVFTDSSSVTIEKYQLPSEMPISFITGLEQQLIDKTSTGGYAGTSQDLYALLTAIKTIYSSDGTIKETRTIDGADKTGNLVFNGLKSIEVTNNDNFIVENSNSSITTNLFKVDAKKTIDLSVPAGNARIVLEDGLSLQNGSQGIGKYLQSVDSTGKTVWKDLEVSDLSGVAEMVQDLLANSGATDKIASVKAIEDFVAAKLGELIDNSPTALDTLKELADALGNDPDFATTISNQIATKLASGTYTGTAQDLFNEILSLQTSKLDKGSYSGTAADLEAAKRNKTAQAKSITDNAGNLELVGDEDAPGNNFYYGTNDAGQKGYYKRTPIYLNVSNLFLAGSTVNTPNQEFFIDMTSYNVLNSGDELIINNIGFRGDFSANFEYLDVAFNASNNPTIRIGDFFSFDSNVWQSANNVGDGSVANIIELPDGKVGFKIFVSPSAEVNFFAFDMDNTWELRADVQYKLD